MWRAEIFLGVLLALLCSAPVSRGESGGRDMTAPAVRPYSTAHEQPLDVAVREVDAAAGYTQFHVTFNGIVKGSRVPAFLYVPRSDAAARKRPALLLQYGSGGSKTTRYIVAVAKQAVARGFVVLTIDVPGRGERRNEVAADQRPVFRRDVTQTLGDYSRAIDYLVTRDDVDPDRLGYIGISWGAITGVTFAAHDPRIKAVASLVGGGNFLGWLTTPVAEDVIAVAKRWDPFYHVALIAPRPLLLLNVTNDQLVPRFFGESLQKAAGLNAERKWLDTDHFFSTIDRHAVLEDVLEWVETKLDTK